MPIRAEPYVAVLIEPEDYPYHLDQVAHHLRGTGTLRDVE
jgi:hypothetical protein